jgi:hypothetical protein
VGFALYVGQQYPSYVKGRRAGRQACRQGGQMPAERLAVAGVAAGMEVCR